MKSMHDNATKTEYCIMMIKNIVLLKLENLDFKIFNTFALIKSQNQNDLLLINEQKRRFHSTNK